MTESFLEQVVPLLHPFYENATLTLHADGTYEVEPPFRSADLPWPREMGINIRKNRDAESTLPPFEPMNIRLHEDGTYELFAVS